MPQVVGVFVLPRPVVPALVEPQVIAAADLALLDVCLLYTSDAADE